MIRVTVVVPTADRPLLLQRAIASLLNQSVLPDRIIVVDNGYEDTPLDYGDSSLVSYIRTAPRIGPGRSRNIGAEAADTEWVGFLDDDDIWEHDYLEQSLAVLNAKPASVVVGQLKRQDLNGVVRPYKIFPSDPEGQRSIYFKNSGFGGQNFIIDRALFLRLNGFDTRMPASVDRDLAARVLQAGAIIAVAPLAVAVLCDHEGPRVRASQVKGNQMFIQKHWGVMSLSERYKVLSKYLKRFVKNTFSKR